jgi:ribosomal protein S18 acetylase RimI-like enzyme
MKIAHVKENTVRKFLKKEWKKYNKKTKINFKESFYYFAAYDKKKIVGALIMRMLGGVCYVKDFLVADGMRGKGIGELLWKNAEKLARKKKCHRIAIKTNERNLLSIRFYKKHGLKVDAEIKNFHFGLKWYYMSKVLK